MINFRSLLWLSELKRKKNQYLLLYSIEISLYLHSAAHFRLLRIEYERKIIIRSTKHTQEAAMTE